MSQPIADLAMERAYLARCLGWPETLDEAPLSLSDLYSRQHCIVLAAMLALRAKGEPIDSVSVRVELERGGQLAAAGGEAALLSLMSEPPPPNAPKMASEIRRLASLRAYDEGAREVALAVEGRDLEQARAAAHRLAQTDADVGEDEILTFRRLMASGLAAAIESRRQPDGIVRLGIPSIDRDYRPSPGHLVVVGGRPNVGKSMLVLTFHLASADRGMPSGIVSIDDDGEDYGVRGLGAISGVNPALIWDERVDSDIGVKLSNAIDTKAGLPIYFAKIRSRSIEGVESAVQRMVRVHGCRWVSIDFLTAIRNPAGGKDTRERVNDTLSRINVLASVLAIPVVLVVQLKRLGDNEFREPHLSDFKETGEIEEHAKAAILLWRKNDKPHEPVFGKNAKMKRAAAGRRFALQRHPDSGLMVEADMTDIEPPEAGRRWRS